ncbi:MAG: tRNA uridine-5-carboxymethylaminomethyl(34) synthesis GTPase MnmE [Desulforhopalus sp.]|nr:tRNA uridine-5-carboxymethylaminomethyl(34) synthesis GTPase MnmE [Desulforhopalus sp.]
MNSPYQEATIAAISTPPGAGGIGIIRISGDQALSLLKAIFQPKDPSCLYRSHQLYYGHIRQPDQGKILDEVLAVFMAAPHTYTREDVVEVHCHGSFLVLQNVLELILASGAILASPGEFTKRAFLNGRIDLTQAEAVIDVLSAKTRKGVDLAQEQLSGALYGKIDPIRQSLVQMRAVIEVAIDFPDEDLEIIDHSALIAQLEQEVEEPLKKLLQSADRGRLYREGISLVIAGLPNVGKSSLLNTILQEERALVTSIPGTTRDSIEEVVDIKGIPVRIIDTAGIRDNAGEVEELGIQRARDLINKADLILFLIDGSRELIDGDRTLYGQVKHKPVLPVINKIDLCGNPIPDFSSISSIGKCVKISAREQTGIERLKQAVFDAVISGDEQWEEGGCAPNVRHKQALIGAVEACDQVLLSLKGGLTNDLIAVDLQGCLDYLAEIVGETTTEDVLDVIFEQFCLGK